MQLVYIDGSTLYELEPNLCIRRSLIWKLVLLTTECTSEISALSAVCAHTTKNRPLKLVEENNPRLLDHLIYSSEGLDVKPSALARRGSGAANGRRHRRDDDVRDRRLEVNSGARSVRCESA
ncbi:hypothetical protein EVAR_66508_1 [Eumeta japonica]|uniref:Uncharacterized protein n=1 Tax=Eumeta variegata TaxID=151549 RepID=A0A4C1Z7S9_EUMVA|nr:hypothetical protein EVAR_66508_1 [Eumeta japonica]